MSQFTLDLAQTVLIFLTAVLVLIGKPGPQGVQGPPGPRGLRGHDGVQLDPESPLFTNRN